MKTIEKFMQKISVHFKESGKLSILYPVYEALDSFILTTNEKAVRAPFVRDAIDIKRVMMFVVIGLLPCIIFGIYNVGYQIFFVQHQQAGFLQIMFTGLMKVVPIIIVTYIVGGFWEVLFAVVKKHEIAEGFLVTGMLFALILPPAIPLWQVAVGISFGVVFGKEIFGGVGRNIFNPALIGRAFLFFAYPSEISGDNVWIAIDGLTKATPLSVILNAPTGSNPVGILHSSGYNLQNMFFGFIPGSIGETSTFACLLGLVFLVSTKIVNYRAVFGSFVGLILSVLIINCFSNAASIAFVKLPFYVHFITGGFAFGCIFMATDPVSSSATNKGRWVYGFFIGVLVVLIRVFNPAYPEGTMLAILFMNMCAPLIDYFVIESEKRKRKYRFLRK